MGYRKIFITIMLMMTALAAFYLYKDRQSRILAPANNSLTEAQTLSLHTFSVIPPRLEGCSCYFANDSTEFALGRYIFMNDNSQSATLKINGIITRLNPAASEILDKKMVVKNYQNNAYRLTVAIKSTLQTQSEASIKTGTLKLISPNGQTIQKSFYGKCGC